ncbi:UPF0389 protein CG9231 [Palaemon carinicauda]|uniref:UPF0389 protein CG9231 n=1 Tax=Palaemon carinicauda TaxID=392227 RepID=UPI0035B65213
MMMLQQWSSRTLTCLRLVNNLGNRNGLPLFVRGAQWYSTGDDKADKVVVSASTPKDENPTVASASTPMDENPTIKLARLTDHRVDNLEKYLLVWGGKFKSISEVPAFVSQDTMERSRNKARIKINLMMCAATVVACFLMVLSGKKAQREGQNITNMNQEWHRKQREADQAKE